MALQYNDMSDRQKQSVDASVGELVIYAAAGSGKTSVLTERVRRILADESHPVPADRLLIVTFTNAAAAEMKARISEALADEISKNPTRHIRRQQMLLPGAQICTIDAFCKNIIKENFQRISIRPDYRVPDEAVCKNTALTVVAGMFAEKTASGDGDFKLLVDSVGMVHGIDGFAADIKKVYDRVRSMTDPDGWLKSCADRCENADFSELAEAYYKKIEPHIVKMENNAAALVKAAGFDISACEEYFPKVSEVLSAVRNAKESFEARNWDSLHTALCFDIGEKIVLGNCAKESKAVAKTIREQYNMFIEIFKDARAVYDADENSARKIMEKEGKVVRAFTDFVIEFGEKYRAALTAKGYVTFDMTEHLAYDLVCKKDENGNTVLTDIGRKICDSFDAVLVDEYQDNNDLQDAFFHAISDGGKKLFMVGDAKQSIYGFRYANPKNFIRYRDSFPAYDASAEQRKAKIVLDSNFRSCAEICDYVNFVFGAIMKSDTAEMDYNADDMMNAGRLKGHTAAAVEYRIIPRDTNEKHSPAAADDIAKYIESSVNNGMTVTDGKESRPVSYGDFAILLRSPKNTLGIYADALKKRGIPVAYDAKRSFDSRDVTVLLSMLRAVDDPADDVSVLAVLTGPVFSVGIDRIVKMRLDHTASSLYGSLCLAAGSGDAEMEGIRKELSDWKHKAFSMGVAELVREMIEKYGLFELAASFGDGTNGEADLLSLISAAETYDAEERYGLTGFIRYIDMKIAVDDMEKQEAPTGKDAVRIMSVHASKGLEFPICIIAECSSKFNDGDTKKSIITNEETGIAIKIADHENHRQMTPLNDLTVRESIRRAMLAEEQRILYVAMTRAINRLVLVIDGGNKSYTEIDEKKKNLSGEELSRAVLDSDKVLGANNWAEWLIYAALLHKDGKALGGSGDNGIENTFTVTAAVREDDIRSDAPQFAIPTPDGELVEKLKEKLSYTYPYEAASQSLSKTTVSQIMASDSLKKYGFSRRPAVLSDGGLSAAEKGTALHTFMQQADFAAAKRDLEGVIKELREWEYMNDAEAESLDRAAIRTFLDSELCGEMIAAGKGVWREKKFLVPLSGGDTLVQGSVDCAYVKDGGLVIVDFKTTGYETDEEFINAYKIQLDVYAEAMSGLTGLTVTEKYIYSLHLGKAIKVS